jgi:hypothetical protein
VDDKQQVILSLKINKLKSQLHGHKLFLISQQHSASSFFKKEKFN